MTVPGTWGVGAWVVLGGVAVAMSTFVPIVTSAPPVALHRPSPPSAVIRPYRVDSLARVAVFRDVFRSSRRPTGITYDPQRAAAPVEVSQPPKPALSLVGLVSGADASAVIEGFPGVEGARVVRVGDVVSGVRVVRIESDQVRLVGMDTVWVLRVREPWRQD